MPSLAPLPEATLLAIVGDSANLFWAAGSRVYGRGSPADGLYIVLSGRVRILEDGGRELGTLVPGDYFGEFSLMLGTPHGHDVDAVEDSELMVVPKERFDALLADHPGLAASIREQAARRHAANQAATRPG